MSPTPSSDNDARLELASTALQPVDTDANAKNIGPFCYPPLVIVMYTDV